MNDKKFSYKEAELRYAIMKTFTINLRRDYKTKTLKEN